MRKAYKTIRWLVVFGGLISIAGPAFAQDSGPLIQLLVRKGLVTDQEAEELRAELARDLSAGVVSTIAGSSGTLGLRINGRAQVQYADLSTDVSGAAADPVTTRHAFLRRIYLGARAELGAGWGGTINYDFAGSTFDAAHVTWRRNDALTLDIGLRKVPVGLEEWYTSSSSLKAIERSPATRYFVESNNGRRLGAGSYRIGLYAGGRTGTTGPFYNVAITNPERDESSTGAAGIGGASNNHQSYWGNVGYIGRVGELGTGLTYTVSASAGILPDQGGKVLGAGDDLTVFNAFAQVSKAPFDFQAELFSADVERGVSATRDAQPFGFSLQPSVTFGQFEYVVRYSMVDSDGRGINLSDGIRSAPSGGTMNELSEWFGGVSYFFRGNNVKLQLGYVRGETRDTVTGASAKATTSGIRSQMQANF